MRAWEFMESHARAIQPFTIRGLNRLKKDEKNRLAAAQDRQRLLPIMYSNSQWEREMLELERMRLELDQLRAEIASTNAETKFKTKDKITDMARSGIKAESQAEQKITAMAKRGLGRRKKCSTVS